MHDGRKNGDAVLQLLELLGDTLARVQAVQAKEEYALSQIIASIQFVNHTVDSWVNTSQEEEEEEAETSEFQVYESDLSAVSKSIDAVLDEARLVRGSSKRANPKGVTCISSPENAVAQKFKAAEQKKKTLKRFSQTLHLRPSKTVSADHGERHFSFAAAHEKLLRWMETNTRRPFAAEKKHEQPVERSNAASKFLNLLWTMNEKSADSVAKRKVEGAASGGALTEINSKVVDSSTTPTQQQGEAEAQKMHKNVHLLQTYCKLMNQRHLYSELLSPHMFISKAIERDDHHVGNEEELGAGLSWLPPSVCWRVLGTHVQGIMMQHKMQGLPTVCSHLQQSLTAMRLVHSIHTNIFHCHLQAVLAQSSLLKLSPQSSRRIGNVLSSSNVYSCFRLAHCLVCSNGKALVSVARRVDVT